MDASNSPGGKFIKNVKLVNIKLTAHEEGMVNVEGLLQQVLRIHGVPNKGKAEP